MVDYEWSFFFRSLGWVMIHPQYTVGCSLVPVGRSLLRRPLAGYRFESGFFADSGEAYDFRPQLPVSSGGPTL